MKCFGKHTDEVAQRILEAFRHPEQLPQALAPIFIRRNDGVPCRRWSWHNQLLAVLAGTHDARGIRQWNEAGRKVKAGSSAFWILAPCVKKVREQDMEGEESSRQVLYGFRAVPVFAVEDTEGEPLPEQDDACAQWIEALPLLEVARAWDIQVDAYSHAGQAPLGYYGYGLGGKAIMLGVENLSTWTHELIHAADHKLGGLSEAKWHKEIVAELGGAVLLACLGKESDADLGGAYAYIERHAQTAKKDTVKACIEVLDRVCNCVRLILDTAESLQPEAVNA